MSPKTAVSAFVLSVSLTATLSATARADGMIQPEPQAAEEAGAGAVASAGPAAAQGPSLTAKLVAPGAASAKDSAKVEVKVNGVDSPKLQYKVDDGPAFETNDTKVGFRGLTPGAHRISVLLEGSDGAPLGPSETLDVNVPGAGQ